jgi:hypothetical protein
MTDPITMLAALTGETLETAPTREDRLEKAQREAEKRAGQRASAASEHADDQELGRGRDEQHL